MVSSPNHTFSWASLTKQLKNNGKLCTLLSEGELEGMTLSWPRGYKTFYMLNSAEHEIYHAHECENANNCWHFNIHEDDKYSKMSI